MCNITFPDPYNRMSDRDSVMGQCARCGGSLLYNHKCPDIYAQELAVKVKKAHEDAGKSTIVFGA